MSFRPTEESHDANSLNHQPVFLLSEVGGDIHLSVPDIMSSSEEENSNTESAPPPSDQMRASGSGRRKVALPPGRSQLDWMRNSKRLPSKHVRPIPMKEVALHKSKTDAWMVVHDVVYDVTPYLEYHPGGIPIMLSGAGKDATALFEKYHPWVNAQGMLGRCIVGYLADLPQEPKKT